MLEFLILGIVPGTSITLTITWVLIIGLIISLGCLGFVERKKLQMLRADKTKQFELLRKIVRQV
ncbi:hypothetical protein KC946_03920 [Candidatus Saccharibacteria bacterium]|nr:hypothetical protein [Candidatus Saccharibacteria bacterium]